MAEGSEDQGDTKIPKDDEDNHPEEESAGDEEEEESEESEADEDGEDDDEPEDEPKLKYARLTSHLGPVYRNGDATSTFLVAGDKMVGFGALFC
jgi:hypothetical protein